MKGGVAPVIGTVVTIAVVFILASLVSAGIFDDYANSAHKKAPAAKIQVYFTEGGTALEFENNGGDQ